MTGSTPEPVRDPAAPTPAEPAETPAPPARAAEAAPAPAGGDAPAGERADGSALPPKAAPAARPATVLLALGLLALAGAAIHDLLVRAGDIDGPEWLAWAIERIRAVEWQDLVLPTAIIAGVVGLVLIIIAVKPRRVTHLPMPGFSGWIRPADVARRTTMRARRAPGVLEASSAVSATSVTVKVRYAGADAAAAEDAIRRAVAAELAVLLADPPSPTIRLERSKEAQR